MALLDILSISSIFFWLALISLFITYFIVEVVASYFLVGPLSPQMVPDEFVHHKLVPNKSSYFEHRDYTYIQRVNNLGLRGKDIEIKKPSNHYRILMLGDSFTMAKGVEDDQTFSFLVEEYLNQRNVLGVPLCRSRSSYFSLISC